MNTPTSDNVEKKPFWPQMAVEWLELLGKAIFIIAALGSVYQYFDVKQENRVKETMAQVQFFNGEQR